MRRVEVATIINFGISHVFAILFPDRPWQYDLAANCHLFDRLQEFVGFRGVVGDPEVMSIGGKRWKGEIESDDFSFGYIKFFDQVGKIVALDLNSLLERAFIVL